MCVPTLCRWPFGASVVLVAAVTILPALPYSPLAAQKRARTDASAPVARELTQARAALDKYRDPIVAVHDGYLSTLACVEYPQGGHEGTMQYTPGGMGIHFLNLQFIGPILDLTKPQVLIYEPDGDKLRLVAAEWLVPTEAARQTVP